MKRQNVRSLVLVVVMMAYILLGAAIFEALEANNEEASWRVLEGERVAIQGRFNLSEAAWDEITDHLVKYMPHRAGFQWRFAGAVYFSTTVITTIGYGHSTPKTNWGKIFCMLYALVGIPLNLVMFQSIGERLNTFNTFLICGLKRKIKKSRRWPLSSTNLTVSKDLKIDGQNGKDKQRFWFDEQIEVDKNLPEINKVDYYIQINESLPQSDLYEQPKRKVYINLNEDRHCKPISKEDRSFQKEFFHEKIFEVPEITLQHEKADSNEHLDISPAKSPKPHMDLGTLQRASINELLSSSFATSKYHLSDTHLICVTTAFSSVFVAGGAYAFSRFEGWTYLDSLYYCIITLTTVGFGDLVALQNNKELQKKPEYVALNILFILTGLAVVSAAMNLLVLRFLTMNTEDEKRDMIKETILNSKEDDLTVDLLSNSQKNLRTRASSCEISHKTKKWSSLCKAIERSCRIGRDYFCQPPSPLACPPSPPRCPVHPSVSLSDPQPHLLQIPKYDYLYSERFPHQSDLPATYNLYHSRSRLLTL